VAINQAGVILIGVLTSAVLARWLGAHELGRYQMLVAWLGVASILNLPGTSPTMLKASVKRYDVYLLKAARRSLLASLAGTVTLLVAAVLLYMLFDRQEAALVVALVALGLPITAGQCYDAALIGKRQFRASRRLALWGALLGLVLTFGMAQVMPFGPHCFAVLLLVRLLTVLPGLWAVHERLVSVEHDMAFEQELDAQGRRQNALGVFTLIATQADRLILGLMDPVLLGIYHVATFVPLKIKDNLKTLLVVVVMRWGQMSPQENLEQLRRHAPLLFGGGVVLVAALWIALPALIRGIFGDGYQAAIAYAQWFSLTLMFKFWEAAYRWMNQIQDQGLFAQKQDLLVQAAYLVLLVTFVGRGIEGVVGAQIGAALLSALLTGWHFHRRSRL
jgi:O-antigen/teichoic acid export membrane protein